MEKYEVLLEKRAVKQLQSLDDKTKSRVADALTTLEEGFSARLDIKKLKGFRDTFRLRVGGYRIFYVIAPGKKIKVFAILPRESAFERYD